MKFEPDLDELEEALRVLRAIQGDRKAFRELVDIYEQRVLYFIRRSVGDAESALDILQETWIDVFRLLPKLRAPEAFRVWLYRIARGKTVEHLRRQNRDSVRVEPACDVEVTTSDDEPLVFDNVELVHVTLGRLSMQNREILTLYFLEGMRLAEVAEVLNCPLGTAKSRMYYAKRAFREAAGREEP